jgi:peptidoglycan/xylan/chitin deacetylase (PgdA/CDA1 family)
MPVALFLLLAASLSAREVAITIDDLPFVGVSGYDAVRRETDRLLRPIREQRVPLTAFTITGGHTDMTPEEWTSILRMWTGAGAEIGNHTHSHRSLSRTPLADYTADILKADALLTKLTGKKPRYFRSPMLHTGADAATKDGLERFLRENGYEQSPVTYDNSDWMFAWAYARALDTGDKAKARRARDEYLPYLDSVIAFFEQRSVEVVGREFPQVMLLHANRLNADMMPELLAMFRRRGYRFISLEEALRDEAYRMPNTYAGPGGFSWIHRWSMTKGMKSKGEPDEPAWIRAEYESSR